MKSAINKELQEIQAIEYNPAQHWQEDLFCPVCGEPVTFVNASSGTKYRSAHFKHISGKYSNECELYIPFSGRYNITAVREMQSVSEGLSLLVNIKANYFQFYIGINFSEDDLLYYEANKTELKISYSAGNLSKSETLQISRTQFSANKREKFQLCVGCKNISVSISNKVKTISCADGITYYHVINNESNDGSIWARKIDKNSSGQSLYIGEQYAVIVPKYTVIRNIYNFKKQIKTAENYDLYLVEINEFNDNTVNVCKQQGYNLKNIREQFDILWPPVRDNYDYFEVNSNELYASSNIELVRGSNIICDDIILVENIYIINFNSALVIKGESKDIRYIFAESHKPQYSIPQFETIICKEILADNTGRFYLFDSCGIKEINVGQKIKLFSNRIVQQNNHNYPLRRYICNPRKIEHSDWVSDALRYYNATENFEPTKVIYSGTNPYVWQYLQKAKNGRLINGYIKRKIMENADD